MGAHFEAVDEGVIMAPLHPRYTQFDFISSLFKCAPALARPAKEKNKVMVSPYSADPLHNYTADKPDKLPK